MKVVIGGASGYVGRALAGALAAAGDEVVAVARAPGPGRVGWEEVASAVDRADAVVNLAAASVGAPLWTGRHKRAIRSSRVETNRTLAAAIAAASRPPAVLVTASGIDFYGDSGEQTVDEDSPAGGSFLAGVCVDWEAAAAAAPVRTVAVRTALVVGPAAPALQVIARPVRLYLGGPAGGGQQYFPWIHVDDLVGVYRRALADAALAGPVNAVAPELVRQRDLAAALGALLHRPALLPAPAFALRLLLGEQADLLLHGQRAVSRRLGGFDFRYPTLRAALADALA